MSTPRPAGRRRLHATIIIGLFVVAVAAAAFVGWRYARESPPHQGPIVLIAVDGLRADTMPGGPRTPAPTTALEALAADSVVFSRAYAHSTLRVPALASIATGQLPYEHGVRDNGGFVLRDGVRTMADLMRNHGFSTGGVASTFLLRRATGLARGFAFYNADMPEADPGASATIERDGERSYDTAETWMKQQGNQRYFLMLDVPHESAEAVVGKLVTELKARNLYDQATIIFTGERGDVGTGASIEDASIHVPLAVKLPGQEGAGRVTDVPVQHIDLLPTMLDFVRAPVPGSLRGRSLRPLLDDEQTIPSTSFYSESLEAAMRFGGYPVYALTTGAARLIRGASDRLVMLDGSAPDARQGTALGSALDTLLKDRPVPAPSPIAPADIRRYALAGYVEGLRTWMPPMPALEPTDQTALVEAHRAAVRRQAVADGPAELAALRAMARTHPTLASIQFQLGQRLLVGGRLGEGITALKAADALRPADPQVATALALALLRAGEPTEAAMFVEQALTRAQDGDLVARVSARLAALQVALAAADATAAAAHAADIERLDPTLPLGDYVEGRIAYGEKRYEDAAAALQNAVRALDTRPDAVPDLPLALGQALEQLGRDEEAETAFKQAITTLPWSVSGYAALAGFYQQRARTEDLSHTLDALTTEIPTTEGFVTAAKLWTAAGNRARADAVRAEARRRFRGDPALSGLR